MIRVEINPTRVERVVLESKSEMERDFDQAAYLLIQPLLNRIDRRLRSIADAVLKPTNNSAKSLERESSGEKKQRTLILCH